MARMVCSRAVVVGAAVAASADTAAPAVDSLTTDAPCVPALSPLLVSAGDSRVSRAIGGVTTLGSMRIARSFVHRFVRTREVCSGRERQKWGGIDRAAVLADFEVQMRAGG